MKYIHIVQFHLMSGGGVGSVITDLCEAMSKESDQVYVISLFRRDGIDYEAEVEWARRHGITSKLMQDSPSSGPIKVLLNLRRTLKDLCKNDTCCLYMHLKWGVLAGVVSSLGLPNLKRVEVYHSGYLNYRVQAFCCKPFIHKYISVSKEAKNQLEQWFHIDPGKVEVAYNGVDIDHIQTMARYAINTNSKISFMSVGRLSFEKGFLTSIEAFASLSENGDLEGCSYTMIGHGVQLDEAKALGKGRVTFTGVIPRDSVYSYISGCDVMILPSWWEGNSILLLEVLCIGKALIVSDIPSFREVLNFEPLAEHETCRLEPFGVVFKAKDVRSCTDALLLIRDNVSNLSEMANNVHKLADTYSIVNQTSIYKRIAYQLFNN